MQLHNLLKPSVTRTSESVALKDGDNRTNAHRAIVKSSSSLTGNKLNRKSKSKPQSADRGGENLVKEIQAMIISQEI